MNRKKSWNADKERIGNEKKTLVSQVNEINF